MKSDGLTEIVMWAVRHSRLSQKVVRRSPSHNSEVVALTLHLLNSRHTFKCLVIDIVVTECRRLELLTELPMNPIEQMLSRSLNFLKMSRQFFILVWDEMHVLAPRYSERRTGVRSQ